MPADTKTCEQKAMGSYPLRKRNGSEAAYLTEACRRCGNSTQSMKSVETLRNTPSIARRPSDRSTNSGPVPRGRSGRHRPGGA